MKAPSGTTPVRECSLRSRKGRRPLSKSELAEGSYTRDLEMLSEAERDVWEGPKDVKAESLPTLGAGHRSKRISGGAVALVAVGVAALGCGGAQGAGGTPQA